MNDSQVNTTEATLDSAAAAEQHAAPILKECACTHYVGSPTCRHQKIHEDRMRSFLAGVRWARSQYDE